MAPVVGFVGGLFAFGAAPAIGSAAFGSWALGSAIGGTFLGSLTVKLLTTVAFSALQRALMPSQERGGGLTISTTVSGEDQPETIILGRYATGGFALCPPYSHGPSNKYLTHIIEVCSAPGATLERFMLGDEWIEFGPTSHPDYGRPATGDKYGGRVWLKYYNGTQTEADPMLIAKYGSHPDRPWTANMVGSGLCYAVLTFEYNQEKMAQVPRYRFELKGVPLYDPRKDSTAGGLGPQRISQPTTWQQTENAAVLVWNIMRGIALPGGELWGGAISDLSSLPKSAWIAAMNRCDATVDIEDGTEPMYRAGIEVSLSDPPAAAIEEILKACSGSIADLGYGWGMVAGAPSLPVYSFTDEDVIVSEKQDLDPFPGLQDTYNAVSAKFPDPKHYWETREAPQRTNAVWEASDAFGRRAANLNLAAVPFADQVQRLTLAWLNDERRFIQHTISVPPDAAHLELMDTVMWTSARNGYSNKTFQISEFVEDPKIGIRQMLIRECEASDWIVPVDYILPTPPVPQPSRVVPSVLDGFSATPLTLLDVNHIGRRGAVRIAWSVDLIGDGVRYQIRLPAAEVAVSSGTTQMVSAGYLDVFDGLLPATQYEARAQLIADRSTPWTAWLSVTTPDVRIGAADLDNDVVAAITPDTTPPAVPTALSVTTSIVSDAVSLLVASWSAPADLDLDGYEVRVKVGAGDFVVRISAGTRYEERLSPGETYSVQVRAFDTSGNRSAYTALASGTAVKDTTPPAVPTGLVINAGYQMLWVKWDPNSESDLHHYEIYEQASSTPAPTLATAATFTSADAQMARTSLPSSLTRHYWVRAVDTTGNKSAWSPRKQGTTAASAGVNSAALAGLVDATSFASGIKPVEVVATLPAAPHVQGRQVFLTSDNKLYRNTGSGWTKEVDGVDLKANTVTTGALAAGAVNTAQLAAGAATIDKLAVRSSQTVNVDPFYEDASAWIAPNITRVAAPAGGVGPWWLQAAAPGTNVTFPNNRSPIDPTKSYLLEGWLARLTPTGNGKSFFTVNFFTANGTPVASGTGWPGLVGGNHYFPSLSTIPTQTPARHTITIGPNGTAAIPANAAFISFGFFWNYESTIPTTGLVGPIRMTEMAAGEAIIDGTLQARHVTAGEFITNTAQIKDAIITDAKVASLSAAKLKAGTALVGSITVNGRALATVAASDAYIENMGNAAHWGNYVGVAPTFVTSPDAKVGTDVLQSNGYCWAYGNQPVIFDPNKLYRVTAIVRRSGANAGGMLYLGLVGYAENGTTLVNTSGSNTPSNQHYCVAAAVPQTTLNLNEWTEFVGYVKGVSAVGSGGVGILEAPSKMHALVKKIAPLLILNYNTGTTPMQVDYFRIEVVNEDAAAIVNAGVTNINGGKIETNTLEASAIKTSSFSAAGLAVFDGQLKSSDFVAGAEGWEINDDGSAEFNSLKVRRDMIVDGAISRRAILPGGFSVSIAPGTWTALSPRIITATAYFDPAPYDHDTHPTNTSLMTFNCVCKPGSIHGGVLSLLFQREISGVWTTEWFRDIVLPTAEQPFHVMLRAVGGIFADPIGAGEWRVGAYVSYGSVAWVDVSGVMCTFEQINR